MVWGTGVLRELIEDEGRGREANTAQGEAEYCINIGLEASLLNSSVCSGGLVA